jgi:hypothetical protein
LGLLTFSHWVNHAPNGAWCFENPLLPLMLLFHSVIFIIFIIEIHFSNAWKNTLLDNYNKIFKHAQQQTFILWNKKWVLYSQIPQLGNVYDTQHLTCQQPH